MAKLSVDELLEGIKELSVIEAADLATKMQEEFGIEAAAPVMAAAGAPGAAPAEAAAEKDEYDVVITSAGDKKIQVIKEVRAHTQLGLKEAKELVDNAPNTVREGVPKDEADKIRAALEEAGASVELK